MAGGATAAHTPVARATGSAPTLPGGSSPWPTGERPHAKNFLLHHPSTVPTDPAEPVGMTPMEGGGPEIDWAALAPHIENPVREGIVEAIRWIGEPLSKPDLFAVLRGDDPDLGLSAVSYHVAILVDAGALVAVAERATAGSMEALYFFAAP